MPAELPADSTPDSAARQILRGYSSLCQPRMLNFLDSGGGFSGARLWRVEGTGGIYALRAMPLSTVNVDRLAGLHRLLAHVRDCGLAALVATPLLTLQGTTFVVRHEHVWQLEPWLPGVADFAARPSSARLRNALRALARWHVAARSFVPTAKEAPWFASFEAAHSPGIAERLRAFDRWPRARLDLVRESLQKQSWPEFDEPALRILELFPRVAPSMAQKLRLGATVKAPLQPCLRDIWHDHVLYTGDQVSGLIDAHACRTECVATDLARLLGSLVADDRPAWDEGLVAYSEVRPLGVAERGLVELFDESAVLLSGLTWLEWHCVERRRFAEPRIVVDRLRRIVRRLETLTARN